MKLNFLHVSDLHYRPEWHEESELVCNAFLEDLALHRDLRNLYLIFSGDLVLAGESEAQYGAFLKKFGSALDGLGLPRERRVCIPGNHDVSRASLKPLLTVQQGTLGSIRDEQAFNDILPQLKGIVFDSKFANYKKAEAEFAQFGCCGTTIGGQGHELDAGVGIYCLNTALCSCGGLQDHNGNAISDRDRLQVETRTLHQWIAATRDNKMRILVMHHPLDWLAEWARFELETVIANNFQLLFSGHIHRGSTSFWLRGANGHVQCAAPPLFTRKESTNLLGYGLVTADADTREIEVCYRQWSPTQRFVAGSSLAGNDSGRIKLNLKEGPPILEVMPSKGTNTAMILQHEFDETITCYSSKRRIWVGRDLAVVPETVKERAIAVTTPVSELVKNFRSCVIRAPKLFGLSSLGRYIALENFRDQKDGATLLMLDSSKTPPHPRGIRETIDARCHELAISKVNIKGFILDNWKNEKGYQRILQEIQKDYPQSPVLILQGLDDSRLIASGLEPEGTPKMETCYLWALSRPRIRELVAIYLENHTTLDEEPVLKKLITDIDALNIHRTPLNCLLILRLLEEAFDDSPLNRTDMIGRVLHLLFYEFDQIPRYSMRPDLKDCEYALGYVCEWLIRSNKFSFTKAEFCEKARQYCSAQILDLDCEVLFTFLLSENILVRIGGIFGFRFAYWLYYFAAHRMHHDPAFASYMLTDRRYGAIPEIVEFYTGIDRRRADAVRQLTHDLRQMNSEFLARTGIADDFNPYSGAQWQPNDLSVEKMKQQIADSLADSSLPQSVKDVFADKRYDPAKPYQQELSKFIIASTLGQMVQAMRGAARALRNSDHVPADARMELLTEVIRCWIRVVQIIAMISPYLAEHRNAQFEGIHFILDQGFDNAKSMGERWGMVMTVILDNVVDLYQEDIFSRKLGALLSTFVQNKHDSLSEILVLLVVARQRPPGWEREIEEFIVRSKKNSFYLARILEIMLDEYKHSFATESMRQQLRRLCAMTIAKHHTGAMHPNLKLVEKAAKDLDNKIPKSQD